MNNSTAEAMGKKVVASVTLVTQNWEAIYPFYPFFHVFYNSARFLYPNYGDTTLIV